MHNSRKQQGTALTAFATRRRGRASSLEVKARALGLGALSSTLCQVEVSMVRVLVPVVAVVPLVLGGLAILHSVRIVPLC